MFRNKVIIITGSTQGIGLTVAAMLLREGACVVINSRSPQKVEAALGQLRAHSGQVIGFAADVSKYESCQALRDYALSHFGHIDILINNAGVAASGLMKDALPHAFEQVVDINLLGSIYPTMACLEDICQQKGAILFISSVAGIIGLPHYSAYAATKRALVSLAESLRSELADDGVFVGVNYPGFTENDPQKTIINAKGEEILLKKRAGVKALSRETTAAKILEQLEKRKFSMYSSFAARAIHWIYRLFPRLSLNILRHYRHKISAMQ